MSIFEAIKIGLIEIFSNKVRSLLTMLGVIFGVGAVIAIVSIGEGARVETLRQLESLGVRNIVVEESELDQLKTEEKIGKGLMGLTFGEALALSEVLGESVEAVCAEKTIYSSVFGEEEIQGARVIGTDQYFPVVNRVNLAEGRFLSAMDIDTNAKVCVIGAALRREVFAFDEAIDQKIRVGEYWLTVVGVLEDTKVLGSGEHEEDEDFEVADINMDLYLPLTTSDTFSFSWRNTQSGQMTRSQMFKQWYSQMPHTPEGMLVQRLELKVAPGYSLLAVAKFVERFLTRSHDEYADFRVSIPSELLRQRKRTQRVFNIVLGAVAGITLLVGGIGIMNIMLATVSQRVREIGIRRSIGASEEDILFQFLIESVTIAFIGGVIGILFGILLANVIAGYADWAVVINAKAVIVSVTVSTLVGVIFGFYPAEKASRLDPIEALRV